MPQEREERETVRVEALEKVESVDVSKWPSGDLIRRGILSLGGGGPHSDKSPQFWQASARWALLKKYGYLSDVQGEASFCQRTDFVSQVTSVWLSLSSTVVGSVTTDETNPSQVNDLVDFLVGSQSRGRKLQFDVMDCAPGCQFNLHAHPNLELVFCLQGELHEVRMEGPPLPNTYDPHPTMADRVKGPNLSSLRRPWRFATLREGTWLVNEAGSIHKSFTATSGSGCRLLTLWSGSHANILEGEEPADPNVGDTVNRMDQEIARCQCSSDWRRLEQTFLPASERRL